jgi:hypothetical protein
MRKEIQEYLNHRPDLKFIVREQPHWYILLSRNPYAIQELEASVNTFYGNTFGQKLDRWNGQLQSVTSMLSLLGELNQNIPK